MSPENRDSVERAEPGTPEYERAKADLEAAIAHWRENVADQVELTSGVVLGLKSVPQAALRRVINSVERPHPPLWRNPDSGIDEEVPTDPDYLAALDVYYQRIIEVTSNVLFALGTYCRSVPEGMYRPEEQGWIDELAIADIKVDTASEARRYKEWLDLYAVRRGGIDQGRLLAAVIMFAGYLIEAEVLEAINSFRSRAARRASARVSKKAAGGDGPDVRAGASRGRARGGRA